MSIIDDFADIAKRMKGELAPKPKVEEVIEVVDIPQATWRMCGGGADSMPPIQAPKPILCTGCRGTGLDAHSMIDLCHYCKGKGLAP